MPLLNPKPERSNPKVEVPAPSGQWSQIASLSSHWAALNNPSLDDLRFTTCRGKRKSPRSGACRDLEHGIRGHARRRKNAISSKPMFGRISG